MDAPINDDYKFKDNTISANFKAEVQTFRTSHIKMLELPGSFTTGSLGSLEDIYRIVLAKEYQGQAIC